MGRLQCLRYVSALTAGVAVVLAAGTTAVAAEDIPHSLIEAIHAAVDVWSEFAMEGDPAILGSSFVSNGPQGRQFEAESAALKELPGGEPLRLEIRKVRLRSLDSTSATVWVRVEATRSGFVSEVFDWDFDLIHQDGRWQVWTVMAADEPPVSLQTPAAPASNLAEATATTTASPTSLASSGAKSVEAGQVAAKVDAPPRGTRLSLVSAWVVVITVLGVAIAGYMAPRIDRRGEG